MVELGSMRRDCYCHAHYSSKFKAVNGSDCNFTDVELRRRMANKCTLSSERPVTRWEYQDVLDKM